LIEIAKNVDDIKICISGQVRIAK